MLRFADPAFLWLLLIPALLPLVLKFYRRARVKAMLRLTGPKASKNQENGSAQMMSSVFFILALAFGILALARPQAEPERIETKVAEGDLIILLDVSKSMLAEDLKPNRLERAKDMIAGMTRHLGAERLGLMLFAGGVAIPCPLTHDLDFFRHALAKAGPDQVKQGGSRIGHAIETTLEWMFYDQAPKNRQILLITDGEDHESDPIAAARHAAQKKVRIHAVGIGDTAGAMIPLASRQGAMFQYQNQSVRTRLDEETLIKIASITGGSYLPVGTALADLGELYQGVIAKSSKTKDGQGSVQIWRELFAPFLLMALALFAAAYLRTPRKKLTKLSFF